MKRLPLDRPPAAAIGRYAYGDSKAPTGAVAIVRRRARGAYRFASLSTIPARHRRASTWRRWAIAAVLLCLPALVYWPALFERYGFRDDYSVLRESHEEPGKVTLVCAMQARPIDGALMEASFRQVRGIQDFRWLRFGSALCLGLVGAATFLRLRSLKWDRWIAALVAALFVLLPCSQIVVSWAVGWPLFVSLLLALGAFACAERAFAVAPANASVAGAKAGWWAAAVVLVAVSALIYQSNSLFYLAALAAALWAHRRWTTRHGIAWLIRHAATLSVGLLAAFTATMTAFARGWVPVSRRVAFEHDWLAKIEWFIREPLRNALAVIVLNDDAASRGVHRMAALVAVVIAAGLARAAFNRRWRHGTWWVLTLPALIVGSFAVNLSVADRWPAYRVLAPLSLTVVVALAIALLALGGRRFARLGLLVLVVPGAWLARRQTSELIAQPQSAELRLLEAGAARINPAAHPRVFVLTPSPQDHIAPQVFSDEFGSLSTDSDWVPKEMLKLIMRERFPAMSDVTHRYTFASGRELPKGQAQAFDVIIDLRRVRDLRWR